MHENNQLGKNRELQTAMGYMLGVGASVGSMGLVVTPEFWQGLNLIRKSDHPVELLKLAMKTEAVQRGQDFNMFMNQDDLFGAGMVTGRTVADTIMIADAVGSLATLATRVAVAGGKLIAGGYEWALQGGKLKIVGSAISNIYSATRPMEEVFPELNGVNPHYVEDAMIGTNTNCASCANATQARLTGKDIEAVANPSKGYANKNDLLPSAPFGFNQITTVAEVEQAMVKAGNDAVGVVIIHQAGDVAHVINTVNKNGVVYFIDAQMGKIVQLRPGLKLELGVP